MTKEQRLELINEARELGLKAITIEGVVYDLSVDKVVDKPRLVPDVEAKEILSPMSILDEYTEEEILYWSTPEFDEIQRRKEQHAEYLKNKEVNDGKETIRPKTRNKKRRQGQGHQSAQG